MANIPDSISVTRITAMMNDKVFETIGRYGMIHPGDNVMVCVSGGADSMALLSFLWLFRQQLGIENLFACHFNHGLRGQESDADEQLVRDYCAQHGIELLTGQGNMLATPLPSGKSVESHARQLRYDFFSQCAAGRQPVKIAVAHTRNDVAETILFNLARGSGIKGARGMPPVRGDIIRPLYDCTRQQVEAYCAQNNMPYAVDSTNASLNYARNRVRHTVLPQLELVHDGALEHIAQFGGRADEVWRYLGRQAAQALQQAQTPGGYAVSALCKNDPLIVRFALKQLIEQCGIDAGARSLQAAEGLLNGSVREVQLDAAHYLSLKDGQLFVRGADADDDTALPDDLIVVSGESKRWGEWTVTCRLVPARAFPPFIKNSKKILNNSIDYDKITGNVMLRRRRPGDSFTSHARGHTKSLKKLFNEMGIPPALRTTWPLLGDDAGILWVEGQGTASRAAIDADTTTIFQIQVTRRDD